MAYIKTNWENGKTPISADNLNKIEQGIENASNVVVLSKEPTGGEEVWIKVSKNLFNKNDYKEIDGYFNNSQTSISSSSVSKCIYIPIEGGKTYTISKCGGVRLNVGTTSQIPNTGVALIDNANNTTSDTDGKAKDGTKCTLTTSANSKYLVVWYYSSDADTISQSTLRNSIKIEEGSDVANTSININNNGVYEPIYIKSKDVLFEGSVTGTNNLTLSKPYTNYKKLRFYISAGSELHSYIDISTDFINSTDSSSANHGMFGPITNYISGKGSSISFLRFYKVSETSLVINQIPLYTWDDSGVLTITQNGASVRKIEGIND